MSNDEVKPLLSFPSAFVIHSSTCPLCPQADLRSMHPAYECHGYLLGKRSSQGRRVFCGSVLTFYTSRAEVLHLKLSMVKSGWDEFPAAGKGARKSTLRFPSNRFRSDRSPGSLHQFPMQAPSTGYRGWTGWGDGCLSGC